MMLQQLEAKQLTQEAINTDIEQALLKADQVTEKLAITLNKQADTLTGLQNGMMNLNGKFDTLTTLQTTTAANTTASIEALTTKMKQLFDLINRQTGGTVPPDEPVDQDGDADLTTPPPTAGKRRAVGAGPQADSSTSS